MKRILFTLIALVTLGAAVYSVALLFEPAESTLTTYVPEEVVAPTSEEMLKAVNAERVKVGVEPLVIDENVQKSAQLKADDFAERDYYSHNVKGTDYTLTDEMASYINKSCTSSSENINNYTRSSIDSVESWYGSKPHREAMLSPEYKSTGFGIAKNSVGTYYTVQHLCVVK